MMHKWMRTMIGLVLVISVSFLGSAAWAGAVLFIGDPADSGTFLYNGEVQPFSTTRLQVLENGNGGKTLDDPAVLLILGVPNVDGTYALPDITVAAPAGWSVGDPTTLFSGNWDTNGYAGSFTSAYKGSVYDFIGLVPKGNASNSFGNWAAADLAVNEIVAESFGIFVYQLTGTGLTGGSSVWVKFDSALGIGTFAVAYGQADGKAYSTPFTRAGLTVPEPGALVLFGSGLIGLVVWRRKRRMA